MSATAALEAKVLAERRRIDQLLGSARSLRDNAIALDANIKETEGVVTALAEAALIYATLSEERQTDVHRKIEDLVTHGLSTIFDLPLSFHIVATSRGKITAADLVIRSQIGDEVVETGVLEARGGGLAAVVGFLLRVVILLLTPGRRLLVLDETFAQLSQDYEPSMAEFLRQLADKAQVQIIMVTHSDAFNGIADKVYTTRLTDGRTVITSAK